MDTATVFTAVVLLMLYLQFASKQIEAVQVAPEIARPRHIMSQTVALYLSQQLAAAQNTLAELLATTVLGATKLNH